jgi:hypothetical protein
LTVRIVAPTLAEILHQREKIMRTRTARDLRRVFRVPTSALLAGVAFAMLSAAASSTLYKWTDADGRVVYSDQPPVDRKVDKTMKRAPAPQASDERPAAEADASRRNGQDRADVARGDEAKEGKEAGARTDECARVRASLELLKGDGRLFRVDAKGQEVAMDEQARRRATDEANGFLKAYCGN